MAEPLPIAWGLPMMTKVDCVPSVILASASAQRLALLQQIGFVPDRIVAAQVDECPMRAERPRALALRLAIAKVRAVQAQCAVPNPESGALVRALTLRYGKDHAARAQAEGRREALILGADTVVARGRRLFAKPQSAGEARAMLTKLSGASHRVYTAVALASENGPVRSRIVETRLRFKRLSAQELEAYLDCGEWRNRAGAYAIQGIAGAFVEQLVGSYSAVVGLPLYETRALLVGAGCSPTHGWMSV